MELIEKLENQVRLNFDEAVKLWDLDLPQLAKFANAIRTEKNGKKVYFNSNRHINPSNLCADTCKFCAFSAHRKNQKDSYTMSEDEIMAIARDVAGRGIKELHIVSSHNPNITPEWYFRIFKKIKSEFPNLHIKAMTAAEVDFFKRKWKMSLLCLLDN